MANLEILALDTATPQIRAPGAGDGYVANRTATFNDNVSIFDNLLAQPLADAQTATFRRFSSTQTSLLIDIQTEANASLASFDKTGALTTPAVNLGVAGAVKGILALSGNTSGTVTIQPAAAAGTYTLTLPTDDGSAGQFLKTDGSGILSWDTVSASAAGSDTYVQFNDGGNLGAEAAFAYNKTTNTLSVEKTALGTAGSALGVLTLSGNTSGTVTIQPAAAAGTYTLTLPTTDGDASQVLTTDGSGVLSWTTPAPASVTIDTTATSGGASGRLLYDSGTVVTESSKLSFDGTTLSAPAVKLQQNISAAAWTTNGIKLVGGAATLTDTSSSGTVAAAYTNVLGGNTIAASSATTFTDYASLFLNEPTAGSNVTLTNKWSLIAAGSVRAPSVSLGVAGSTLGTLKLSGNTSGTVTVQPAAAAGTYSLTLPNSAGSANQVLTTDGSGALSWTTPSSSTSSAVSSPAYLNAYALGAF